MIRWMIWFLCALLGGSYCISYSCSSAHVLFVSNVAYVILTGIAFFRGNRWLHIVSLFIGTETPLNTGEIFWQVYGEGAIEAADCQYTDWLTKRMFLQSHCMTLCFYISVGVRVCLYDFILCDIILQLFMFCYIHCVVILCVSACARVSTRSSCRFGYWSIGRSCQEDHQT